MYFILQNFPLNKLLIFSLTVHFSQIKVFDNIILSSAWSEEDAV